MPNVLFAGMITAVGILNLQMVDLHIPRNLFIAGFSLFLGLSVPQWVSQNSKTIDTGTFTYTHAHTHAHTHSLTPKIRERVPEIPERKSRYKK